MDMRSPGNFDKFVFTTGTALSERRIDPLGIDLETSVSPELDFVPWLDFVCIDAFKTPCIVWLKFSRAAARFGFAFFLLLYIKEPVDNWE
jgi:hypothetical protein